MFFVIKNIERENGKKEKIEDKKKHSSLGVARHIPVSFVDLFC